MGCLAPGLARVAARLRSAVPRPAAGGRRGLCSERGVPGPDLDGRPVRPDLPLARCRRSTRLMPSPRRTAPATWRPGRHTTSPQRARCVLPAAGSSRPPWCWVAGSRGSPPPSVSPSEVSGSRWSSSTRRCCCPRCCGAWPCTPTPRRPTSPPTGRPVWRPWPPSSADSGLSFCAGWRTGSRPLWSTRPSGPSRWSRGAYLAMIALSLRSRGPEQLFAVYRLFPVVNTVVGGAMFCVVGIQQGTWPFN